MGKKGELDIETIYRYAEFDTGDAGVMANMIISERKQRADNPGVWDGSPEYAGCVLITYKKDLKDKGCIWSKYYERTLPKTKAREIAEKAVNDGNGFHAMINGVRAVDVIEQAILEYEKQTKGE